MESGLMTSIRLLRLWVCKKIIVLSFFIYFLGKKRSSAVAGYTRNKKIVHEESEYLPSDYEDDFEDKSVNT
jgi:hypothetical protein